ncbi:28S ribosomal protein S18c [Prionailurus iriomotensis]
MSQACACEGVNEKVLRRRIENLTDFGSSAEPLNRVFGPPREEPRRRLVRTIWKEDKEEEERGSMAALVAVCSDLGRKKLAYFIKPALCLRDPKTHAVLWRSCSQYTQVASNEDLPIPMENPYKEPLKKCILCGKRVDYKNVQGLCGKKQKEITKAIKRAQIMGFMPVTYKDPAYLKDPKVCNIKYRE